ncbi:MAG: recombination regulator RecX [Mogibacterium sp.]|nr:recombination regulator RecX [Mogibacterium sp.]
MSGSKADTKKKKTAMEAAASYLADRMRTIAELRKYLGNRDYTNKEIDETVSELIGLRYLDDYQYALRYYEYNYEKKRGMKRAARELAEKGVDRETIRNAGEDFIYENSIDEYEMALELARKELVREVDDRLVARVARKLESRGFANDVIIRVLEQMRRWDREDYN